MEAISEFVEYHPHDPFEIHLVNQDSKNSLAARKEVKSFIEEAQSKVTGSSCTVTSRPQNTAEKHRGHASGGKKEHGKGRGSEHAGGRGQGFSSSMDSKRHTKNPHRTPHNRGTSIKRNSSWDRGMALSGSNQNPSQTNNYYFETTYPQEKEKDKFVRRQETSTTDESKPSGNVVIFDDDDDTQCQKGGDSSSKSAFTPGEVSRLLLFQELN